MCTKAISIQMGGEIFAIGDDTGTIAVYDQHINVLFEESRSGERGASRAFRGIAINPQATLLGFPYQSTTFSVFGICKRASGNAMEQLQWHIHIL